MRSLALIALVVPTLGLAQSNADLANLIRACAPDVHPLTMGSIVAVESGGNPYAILDNGLARLPREQREMRSFRPQSRQEAVQLATQLINTGHIVDLGLGMVNHRNLPRLGMTVDDAFDPCRNIGGAAGVLSNFYAAASAKYGQGPTTLIHALSAYNTGDFTRGIRNGYVGRVLAAAKAPLPSLRVAPAGKSTRARQYVGDVGHGVMFEGISLKAARVASMDVAGFTSD